MSTLPVDREEAIRRCLDLKETVIILEDKLAAVEGLCRAVSGTSFGEVQAFSEMVLLAIGRMA